MGFSALPLIIFLMSFTHTEQNQYTGPDQPQNGQETSTKTELPTPTVTMTPDSAVFTGETVNLKCVIESDHSDWTYEWYTNSSSVKLQSGGHYTVNRDTLTIRGADWSDQGQYWCKGQRSGGPNSSQSSSAVSLTLNERPKAELTVSPDQHVFTGEKVTLTCDIETVGNIKWTYRWIKNGRTHHPNDAYSTTSEAVLSFRAVSDTDAGDYSCEGKTSSDPQRSVTSNVVKLTVSAKPLVKVSPDQHVFTGEKVTLTCDIQTGGNTEWKYRWIKNGRTHNPYHPHSTTSEAELSFRAVSDTDAGEYSCELKTSSHPQRSVTSDAVTLTVSAKPVVKVSPDQHVFTGEKVTLTCDIQTGGNTQWTYRWIKNNSVVSKAVNRVFSITPVSDANAGQYSCELKTSSGPQRSVTSAAVRLTVSERPKPVVKVSPDQRVFTGETVTLTCHIQTVGKFQWTYSWIKNRGTNYQSYPNTRSSTADWSFRADSVYLGGQYSCIGERSDLQRSHTSDDVTLTVSDLPKPTVTVTPYSAVFPGETVNLKCEIDHSDWTYEWYTSRDSYRVLQYRHTVSGDTLTIRGAADSDQDWYGCGGRIRSVLTQSYYSVYLSVKASPRSTVTVTPDSAVFTGETVKLKCVIESYSDWTYEWYKDRNSVKLQSDGRYTVNRDTLTIRGAAESDQGQYWCKGQRSRRPNSSQSSSAVSLNVTHLKSKPELRSDPAGAALTGNTVTLTCNTDLSTRWDFYWYKNTQDSEIKMTRTNSYSMKIDSVSDGGQYWCRAGRGEPVYYTQYSDELTLSVTGFPKAVVTVRPDEHVFRGETVTLRCDIKWGGNNEWTHRWQIEQTDEDKHNNKYYNQYNQHNNTVSQTSTQVLKISRVEVFHHGNYSCTGQMGNQSSQRSDAVALTVSLDEAQAAVRVSPQPWLTEGHSVTLICEVPGSSTGWTFSWFRDADHLSDSSRGAGGSYTLSPAALQHTGVYTCRAERGEPAYSSQNSSAQPLWVTGVSASVRLVLRPSRSQHFSSDSLSLSCDSAGWTVRRYTHTNTQDCSAQTGSKCGIQSLSTSDTGVYWCESESGEKRHPLNITVHDGAVILESSADPVIEGETLTLHCLHRSTISSILTADFYKDGSLIQNQTGEMSIPTVSKSDEGFYYCKTESRESPHSWISVRDLAAQISACKIVSFLLTVCPYLSATVVLLFKIYKARAQSAEEQSQIAVAEE
ncbi:Fc receptor-like protein 5 isoform X3 [Danio rerio]|uniref:Fc receptor-like protein 5 isoform X3 n=1 Tax=Danio rerio TaxID=7955 RepID=A0AC58G2S0_DANRE